MHLDTGLMWVDVEDDFSRARRRHVLARAAGWLRGQRNATRILSLDEVIAILGWRGERCLGLRTIQLDAVTGTVDSRHDFDRKFRPASSRVRQRWERLDLAQRRGAAIPPIDVYLVGDMYFVKDGHHRVSVAMATRQKAMDAYVTEVRTRVPAADISLSGLQVRMAGTRPRSRTLGLSGLRSPCRSPDRAGRTRERHPRRGGRRRSGHDQPHHLAVSRGEPAACTLSGRTR